VGRGESLAEAVHGAGQLVAAGPQGAQVLAQLDPHALEGPSQLTDLAAGADARRGPGEVAPGDRPGLGGQLAEGAADQPGQDRAEQGGDQADDHQPEQHDGQQARVDPGRRGGRGDAHQQPGLLTDLGGERLGRHDHLAAGQLAAAGAVGHRDPVLGREAADRAGHRGVADDQGEVGVKGPPGQALELLAVHPDAGRDRPQQAAPRPGRGAATGAQVGALALEHRPAADPLPRGQEHAERGPARPGQEPGVGVAGPPEDPVVGGGHGQEQVGRALAAQHRPHPGRVPGRHGLEQGGVAGQAGHGLMRPFGPGGEGHRGRAPGQLQLGADLTLGRAGDRLPAVGGDRGDRQHHDDDEEECKAGS
jgi:hypothetical protein